MSRRAPPSDSLPGFVERTSAYPDTQTRTPGVAPAPLSLRASVALGAEDDLRDHSGVAAHGIPDLLSSAEVEAIFNRSDRTLRDWARKDRLRRLKIGNSVFYLAEDVRRLIASGLTQSILTCTEKPKHARRDRAPMQRKTLSPEAIENAC
jgi:hypothetical protein